MSISSILLVVLMLVKLVFVIPLATELHGLEWGMICALVCWLGYGSLVYLEETSVRSVN